jgi:uncharacterized protein YndB with AHSA1/START domain
VPGASHFDLVSHWCIPAPVERVWASLVDIEAWPRWWPGVVATRMVQPGDAGGVGRVQRIEWRGWFGHRIVTEIEVVEVLRHERLRGRSRGQLDGEGLWLLRGDGGTTHITYVWRVRLARGWMRGVAPLMAPVFRWNHRAAMASGERGLARWVMR